jgi:uncharacterized protein YcfL
MKTTIKTGLTALMIAIAFTACDPNKKSPANSESEKIDTGKTTTAIDTSKKPLVDSAKTAVTDSTKK